MKIKIYSNNKTNFLLEGKTYNIKNGTIIDEMWFAELTADDYSATKSMLEELGFIAHPASYKEIDSKEYSIFKKIA